MGIYRNACGSANGKLGMYMQLTQVGYLQAWPKMSTLAGRTDAHCCSSVMLPFWDFDEEVSGVQAGCVGKPAMHFHQDLHAKCWRCCCRHGDLT